MPQNKPMKIQWITVNGRQVPLVLPQTYSYADDDWKVTSDQDPLPVVEYGTTEGGVIVPKRVSGEGHELTQLTGSSLEDEHAIPIRSRQSEIEVLPRMIRVSGGTTRLITPSWARGMVLYFLVYGATGVFDQNEGVIVSITHRPGIQSTSMSAIMNSKRINSSDTYVEMIMYPGAVKGDTVPDSDNRLLYVSGLPLTNDLNLWVGITGEFQEGEGFDCRALVQWLA